MSEELNERMNKNTVEKERDLDLEALDTNPKRFNSLVIMDDFFLKQNVPYTVVSILVFTFLL